MVCILGAALLAAAFLCCALGEDTASPYVENQWNYVEGSMDVAGGIPADAEGVLERIRGSGRLRVAMEPYYPPQEFIDPSQSGQAQYVGADVEMAKVIAERMGVELVIVPMDFSLVLTAVMEDTCDLAISALSYTPARADLVTFSKGYYYSDSVAGAGILIREDDVDEIRGVEDLKNKVIVAQQGSLQETMTAENVAHYKEFRRLSTMQEVYGAVQEGSADAAAVDIETALAYIRNHPRSGLVLAEGFLFELEPQFQGDRVAAKKGETQLMYFVNGVIDELLARDQYNIWYGEAEAYAARLELEQAE